MNEEYFVSWEIQLDGETPVEAAQSALDIILSDSKLYTFTVYDGVGHATTVTLTPSGEQIDEP